MREAAALGAGAERRPAHRVGQVVAHTVAQPFEGAPQVGQAVVVHVAVAALPEGSPRE